MSDIKLYGLESFFYSNDKFLVAPVASKKSMESGQAIIKMSREKRKQYLFLIKNEKILKNYTVFNCFDAADVFNSLTVLNGVVHSSMLLSGCTVSFNALRSYHQANN